MVPENVRKPERNGLTCPGTNLIPANIYLFKVNNRNTRKRCEICPMLTIKTPERRQSKCNFRKVALQLY